jgi:hypothetical protein
LDDVLWNSKLFQAFPPHAGRGVVIISVTATSFYGAAGRKDALVGTSLELFGAFANGVSGYPPLDHEDVCIHAMRCSQKWMNVQKCDISAHHSHQGDKQPTAP